MNVLAALLADQHAIGDRLFAGDPAEHERVMAILTALDDREILDNGFPLGPLYQRLPGADQDFLCSHRAAWKVSERIVGTLTTLAASIPASIGTADTPASTPEAE